MKKIISFLTFAAIGGMLSAQVAINEICPANNSTLYDEDGDTPDWFELYNGGSSSLNIGGYKITDDIAVPDKWIVPAGVYVPAFGYITLFASGKDRTVFFDHWETVVYASDTWKYTKPFIEPDSNWRRLTTFNDGLWSSGPGGIGYGDGDDATLLTQPTTSVYMRHVFTIVDTADIASAVFHMDYDDAFVAYINGVEIARANIGVNGTPVAFNTTALSEHEAKMYAGGAPDQFVINEAFLKSFLKVGSNVLAIQVHNVDPWSSDLTSLAWLSLGIKGSITNYGAVPSWFQLNASSLHTNFKLDQTGETLSLISPTGTLLSQRTYLEVLPDNSYGCQIDGSLAQRYFRIPTPNATNNTSAGYSEYVQDPVFSPDGGFYPGPLTLTISSATAGSEIRYTTDGSEPGMTSTLFSSPINVDSTMVIRARAFHANYLEGQIITNTYFIADSSSPTLPVISITVDPDIMFDTVTGIYVKGPNAEASIPFYGANFWQEVEVPAYIEYFDKGRQLGFEQGIGIEIYGNYSRSYPQKSMKIIARDAYGDGTFSYQLFPRKDIHSFKQFILRNAGTDWNSAHMRDALVHTLALQPTDCDVMAYQPSVVYINGQYWGVYNMREKINKYYLDDNHHLDQDSVDLLQYNGLVMEGSNQRFIDMGMFMLTHDLSVPANFAVADSLIDLKNFADYFAIETWTNNWDWLTNNVRYWRDQRPGGKWRYILWDLDNGLGGLWSYTYNSLDTNLHKPFDYTSLLFNKLLTNNDYRNYFIDRYADLLNTTLTSQHFNQVLHSVRNTIDPEMHRHFERWGTGFNEPNWGVAGFGSYDDWRNYQLHELEFFAGNRQITARDHIQETFGLKKQVPVTLNVVPAGAGKIKINTITVDDMPWAGIYFDSVPISITAVANPGYTFGFWQSSIFYPTPDTGITLTFVPDTSDVFTAYFFGAPDTAKVVFSEINYRSYISSDAGDWVELHNPTAWPFDLSKWKFKDADDANMFVFPEGTVLQGGDYLVLSEDLTKFTSIYPTVTNIMGDFHFGLSSLGESIRLVDPDMHTCVQVDFNSTYPWPIEPNGTELTLELLDVNGLQNDPGNWFAGCPLGSPGGPFVPCENNIEEKPLGNSDGTIAVYPNPVSDNLYIEIEPGLFGSADFSLTLFNVSGNPVYKIDKLDKAEVVIENHFAPGLYMYRILGSDGFMRSGKVVME
jgi:hypothetical protein